MTQRFFGVYRGTVMNNSPDTVGRIKITVPAVLGDRQVVAYPCSPYAGPQVGVWMVPPVQAKVWVAFADGNVDYPIILGCFWGTPLEKPTMATGAEVKLIETTTARILIDDQAGSITLKPKTSPHEIVITGTNIQITTGTAKIELSGPKVTVNDGALEVT